MFLDKVWEEHVVADLGDGFELLHVDRHMLHELSSDVAFAQVASVAASLRNPELTFATQDHVISTAPGRDDDSNPGSADYIRTMRRNAQEHGVELFDLGDPRQGIVHVIAPELGIALPGTLLVCGDSHTCTVGGVGTLAWGIGTSEVAHVLATQCIVQRRPKTLRARFLGRAPAGVVAKDLALFLIGRLGARGGDGYAVEYAGPAVEALEVEARLTLCNLSIELGARIGHVAPDEKTYAYLDGRPYAPSGEVRERALEAWRGLPSDPGARADLEVEVDASEIAPQVTWGTSPAQVCSVDAATPDPASIDAGAARDSAERALEYMGLSAGARLAGTPVDQVFIGSGTNSRLSDLREAARVAKGRRVSPRVRALVVPGSGQVKAAAEAEGLDAVFREAGFEWREPGCSMCVAMNGDEVGAGERCVSTSNRNFEGRQGRGARTHLASPATAAAAAIAGQIADPREFMT
jgi:3-isopropylmalate/(R)-2-methylmalate dehydratase large subunit